MCNFPKIKIGENCDFCAKVLIENDVFVGKNVTKNPGLQLWDGITVEDNVFIGLNVTFTNDLIHCSKVYSKEYEKTIIKKGASIGANSTIVCSQTIGENAMIEAGSVVTHDVPAGELLVGNLAGFVCKNNWVGNNCRVVFAKSSFCFTMEAVV